MPLSPASLFNLGFGVIISSSIWLLYGCGGGSSSSSRASGTDDESSLRLIKNSLSSDEFGTEHKSSIADASKSRGLYFPRDENKFLVNQCPSERPEDWTVEWFTTCVEMESEIMKIRNTDERRRRGRRVKQNYPNLKDQQHEEIQIRDGDESSRVLLNIPRGELYNLELIHGSTQVCVFDGTASSDDREHAIFKYLMNCREVFWNKKCDRDWAFSYHLDGTCYTQQDEDPLLREYVVTRIISERAIAAGQKFSPHVITLSPPVVIPFHDGGGNSPKTNFSYISTHPSRCEDDQRVFARLLVEEKVGPTLSRCLRSPAERPEGRDLVVFAIRAFIRLIELLERIHSIGYIHADIHPGNIAFKNPNSDCDFNHPENLIFIDFGMSEFFPHDLGKVHIMAEGTELYPDLNPAFLSVFELGYFRHGRRDDVYRVFQIFADLLSNGELTRLFTQVAAVVKEYRLHRVMLMLKTELLFTARGGDPERHHKIFGDTIGHNALRDKVNDYAGVAWTAKFFGSNWTHAFGILGQMELYVNNQHQNGLTTIDSPDSVPHYNWLILQAGTFLALIL